MVIGLISSNSYDFDNRLSGAYVVVSCQRKLLRLLVSGGFSAHCRPAPTLAVLPNVFYSHHSQRAWVISMAASR